MSRNPQNSPAPASGVSSPAPSTAASSPITASPATPTRTPGFESPAPASTAAVPGVAASAPGVASHRPATAARDADARGSVLIFVVGVLLLLAIVATAFLGSSRSDRTATQQNSFNTQVDLILEGVINAAKSRILSDESIPARMTMGMTSFEKFDAITTSPEMAGLTNDDWLASRVPVTADINTPYKTQTGDATSQNHSEKATAMLAAMVAIPSTPTPENPAVWPAISEAVLGDSKFESPYRPNGYAGSLEYSARKRMVPTFVRFGGQDWPGFAIDTAATPVPGNSVAATRFQAFLAGDADGDGIADSGLFRIPVGQLSGITYFGAVRIVDNNAAININTAQSRDYDFVGSGAGRLMSDEANTGLMGLSGAFPSSVGLAELLRSYKAAPNAPEYDDMSTYPPSATSVNEFTGLNQYHFGVTVATVRPNGVVLNTVDPTGPFDDTRTTTPFGPPPLLGPRPDFRFFSTGEMLYAQLGRRPGSPGRANANGSSTYRSAYVDSLALASRFSLAGVTEFDSSSPQNSENALARKLPLSLDCVPYPLTPTQAATMYPPSTFPPAANIQRTHLARTTPFSPQSDGTLDVGVLAWFTQNFDYLNENPLNPATFMNRRTILTGINGVGDQDALDVKATSDFDYLFRFNASQWTGVAPTGGASLLFAAPRTINAYFPYRPNGSAVDEPTLPMAVPSAGPVNTGEKILIDPKISINTGRFEELFYGYFKTMTRDGFTGRADDAGTPFSPLYNGNGLAGTDNAVAVRNTANFDYEPTTKQYYGANGLYYSDPYIGSRFTPGTIAGGPFASRLDSATEPSVVNGTVSQVEQHPLRTFRSALRPTFDRTTTPPTAVWTANTPRLPADQMVILRAAIAAANLEALRDSSHSSAGTAPIGSEGNDRLIEHRIPLTARMGPGAVAGVGPPVAVVAKVYGLKRQPYITEVYANTTNQNDYSNTIVPIPAVNATDPNPRGYVAIKLYNPYPVAISLQNCRLVGLRRLIDTGLPATPTQYPNMEVQPAVLYPTALPAPTGVNTIDQIELSRATSNIVAPSTYLPYVIPPNGTLVLENVDATNPADGSLPAATAKADDATHRSASSGLTPNVGFITPTEPATQNFAYVPGLQRVVWDRELVLMRPTNAVPPSDVSVPANTLVYTYPIAATAEVSTNAPNQSLVPLDSFDFTGLNVPDGTPPVRTRAEAWHYVRSIDYLRPWRWVYPGRYDGDQSVPTAASPIPRPRQQGVMQAYGSDGLVGWDPTGTDKDPWAETLPATVPPFKVTLNTPAPNAASNANATVATYPDTFTTQLNVVDWPSNSRLTAGGNLWPFGGFRRLADMLQAPFIGSYTIETEANAVAGNSTFLEINPVTMDAAMAEDTDPNDNEKTDPAVLPNDDGSQSREQLGRFVPLRSTTVSVGGGRPSGKPAYFEQKVPTGPNDPPSDFSTENDTTFTTDFLRYGDDTPDKDENANSAPLPVQSGGAINPANLPFDRTNRFRWAASLFDHFTISSPHDDYMPNYPTQQRWQAGMAYAVGDTVQYGQDIFVCRTAQAPASEGSGAITPGQTATESTTYGAPAASASWDVLPRTPVSNGGALAGNSSNIDNAPRRQWSYDLNADDDGNEAGVSTPGLINLNTAPEAVLAKLPWVPRTVAGTITDTLTFAFDDVRDPYPFNNPLNTALNGVTAGADQFDDNAQIAHLIVAYREGNYYNQSGTGIANNAGVDTAAGRSIRTLMGRGSEPFKSLYDLYKVPGFRAAQTALLVNRSGVGMGVGAADGDYSPMPTSTPQANFDNVKYDFEKQTLLMNRVSNLVTMRSDVFTVYALVQGWRNVDVAGKTPELVVQRRAAYIIDRSGVTAQSPTLSTTRVPVN